MLLTPHERPLLEIIRRPDAVLFVGSGLSVWSGLPSWSQLLLRLIEDAETRAHRTRLARDAYATGDLLDAADKLADVMTPLEMVSVMRETLGFADARPHAVHALLTRLGPERFVTTNYDTLIEQQLGLEGRLGAYRTVASRQVAELADIQKASADRFIFKPHGDIADSQGLVLSSTHYSRILLGSSNPLRSVLETLFASRPIIFIGYGLRDPDTMLVLRSLNERYLGSAGEFWAVMADADEELADYWHRQHRVRLVSYPTRHDRAGADHAALADLLRRLGEARDSLEGSRPRGSHKPAGQAPENAELIRYAARLIRSEPGARLLVGASLQQWWQGGHVPSEFRGRHHAELVDLLDDSPGSFVLEGPAGSGKSFAIETHLSRVGRRVLDWCLDSSGGSDPPAVAVLLDARLYQGSFATLATATVPSALDLKRVSQTHHMVLLVDSLDEMPSEQLESAHWHTDLHAFAGQFPSVHVVYGTRRRDLAGNPSLPCYSVAPLNDGVVEEALADVGRPRETVASDLFEALRTPFTLMLGRRFLGRQSDIVSAPSLFNVFLTEAISRVAQPDQSVAIREQLAMMAASIVASGRETVAIRDVEDRFENALAQAGDGQLSERGLVNRLVEAGILTSEIDDHVRFVHRSVTEFLAAQDLLKQWRAGQVVLPDLLATRRWDNAVAWAAAALMPDEAELFVREVFQADHGLALRIARAAEIGRTRTLATVFDALAASSLSWEEESEISHILAGCETSSEAASHLRPLLAGGNMLAGVAASLVVPHLSADEVREWIDRVGRGEVGYNLMNHFGPSLGKRLTNNLLGYFLEVFRAARFIPVYGSDGSENYGAVAHRHGFEAVIAGLNEAARHKLMAWSRRRSAAVRGIVCSGISRFDTAHEQLYMVKQMDNGVDEAIFQVYLKIRHDNTRWQGRIPACTRKRIEALASVVRAGDRHQTRWALHLLRCLTERDHGWSLALQDTARNEPDPTLRRVLHVIEPGADATLVQKFMEHVLVAAPSLVPLEQQAIDILADTGLALNEDIVLKALNWQGSIIVEILDPFWHTPPTVAPPFAVHCIDNWVAALTKIAQPSPMETGLSVVRLIEYLAAAVTDEASRRLLERANAPNDPERDFILGKIVWLMSTLTSDDLTMAAAKRMVELYCRQGGSLTRSPARIATERFVTQVVLPYAGTLEDAPTAKAAIERILREAGRRHGRRYKAPWERPH